MRKPKRDVPLAGKLIRTCDEERRRIARQLHGTAGQQIAALQINLSMVARESEQLDSRAARALEESLELVQACAREVRSICYWLHPPLLDELGLVPALRAAANEFAGRNGLTIDLDLPAELRRMAPEIEIGLFRIVEAALANVREHSGSKTARLRLRIAAGSVTVELADQGHALSAEARRSPGMAEVRQRVRNIGGSLAIKSGGGGTTLRVVVPTNAKF